ncbi:MAG: hypothetical protein EXS37_13950 [Opitutus sp.]|nr:hypothetical protein [Opitutus sp.]
MGQSKKRRSCPAVKRDITSAECGENRHSRYACPESCPFNPFAAANYTALLQTEDALDASGMKRIARENPAVPREILEARRLNPGHGLHAATAWRLYFKRDTEGRTFAERWAQTGFSELDNDERVLFRRKMQMRVALLEVHRIFDAQRFEAVDLLDPTATPMIFVDRRVAADAVRFTTMLTWMYPLPHFGRLSGTGIAMADLGPFSPLEMIDACIAHLGGPAGREVQRPWLAENFVRIDEALGATGLARRRQMLALVDGLFGTATYELRAPFTECRRALLEEPEIAVDKLQEDEPKEEFSEAMVWFDTPAAGLLALIPGRRVLGRVVLGFNEWRVVAMGGARLDDLRKRFEARLGDRVRLVKERRDNLAGQLAANEPPANLALVPPQLLELPSAFDFSTSRLAAPPAGVSLEAYQTELKNLQLRAWFDSPLPALDGRTAREAAQEPPLRARLIELVKRQVRQLDLSNREFGRTDDINALLRELGLAEIDFPPPPRRATADTVPAEDRFDDEDVRDLPNLPRYQPPGAAAGGGAPPWENRPLTSDEAADRLRTGLDAFALAADAMDEIEATGSTLFAEVRALARGQMDERDFGYLSIFLIQVWFALVPRGGPPPILRLEAMAAAIERDAARLTSGGSGATVNFQRLLADSPQPNLLELIVGAVVSSAEKGPKVSRPDPGSIVGMVLILKAVIAEIEHGRHGR